VRLALGLLLTALVVGGCGSAEKHEESVPAPTAAHIAETEHTEAQERKTKSTAANSEAAIERRQAAAEKACDAKGEIVAQGNDETTECVSMEQKEHEIESDTKSGPHYEAEQQANENEAQKRQNEEAAKIEHERSGE
jgi:hypothetical protein